jgi:hypothetical protein
MDNKEDNHTVFSGLRGKCHGTAVKGVRISMKGRRSLSVAPHIEANPLQQHEKTMSGDLTVVLLYEPRAVGEGPVLLAHVNDPFVVEMAAKSVIRAAEERAAKLCALDELIGEAETAEAGRLKSLLTMLLPTSQTYTC